MPHPFTHQSRPSDSPYVEDVWSVMCLEEGDFLMCADVSWDIIISSYNGQTHTYIDGPTTQAQVLRYKPGMQLTGIRFKVGTVLHGVPIRSIVNTTFTFEQATSRRFWLGSSPIEIPTQENADTFVGSLVNKGLIETDPLIHRTLQKNIMPVSRSLQRRFLHSTGLSQMQVRQIQRAWQAMALLQSGQLPTHVATDLGYTDQPHMIKILKHLLGQTPKHIDKIVHS